MTIVQPIYNKVKVLSSLSRVIIAQAWDVLKMNSLFLKTDSQSKYPLKCSILQVRENNFYYVNSYNSISQVCPYKDLGNAKDYTIITLFLMQPQKDSDKPVYLKMQSQEEYY